MKLLYFPIQHCKLQKTGIFLVLGIM